MPCGNKTLEARLAKLIQDDKRKKVRLPAVDVLLDPVLPTGPTLEDWTFPSDPSLIDGLQLGPLTVQNGAVNDKQISFRTLDDDLRSRLVGDGGELPEDLEARIAALEAEQIVQNDRLTALEDAPVPSGSLIDADRVLMMGPESEELVSNKISGIVSVAGNWDSANRSDDNSGRWITNMSPMVQVEDPTGEFPFVMDFGYTVDASDGSLSVFNRTPGSLLANEFTVGVATEGNLYWTAWYQIPYEKLQIRQRAKDSLSDASLPFKFWDVDGSTSINCVFTCEVVQVDLVPIPQPSGENMKSMFGRDIIDPGQVMNLGNRLPTVGRGNGMFVIGEQTISGQSHGQYGGNINSPTFTDFYRFDGNNQLHRRTVAKPMFGSPINMTKVGWYSVQVSIGPWNLGTFHNQLHYVLRIGGTVPPMMTNDDPNTGVLDGGQHIIRNISLRPIGIDPPGKGFMRI